MTLRTTLSTLALSALASQAWADCSSVSLSDVGWTDITSTTSATKQVLQALGYDVDVKILSVPVTFASLSKGDLDAFLGNWMPSQESQIKPYLDDGSIVSLAPNLEGTKYNLVVPTYLYDEGLKTYADMAKFKDKLDGKIYGIEPGNDGNQYLISQTKDGGPFAGYDVVESSEQGMLAQAKRLYDQKKPVVFLGWEPHPMNANFDLKYLTGGQDFFGSEGTVYTVVRKGFAEDCPNVAKLLKNEKFKLSMENEMMGKIIDDGEEPDTATKEWLVAHPDTLKGWLDGVTTKDGGDGLAAVQKAFGISG